VCGTLCLFVMFILNCSHLASLMISQSASVVSKRQREAILRDKLHSYAREFEELADECGLPWVDREAYRSELFANISTDMTPKITSLITAMRRKVALSSQILTLCTRREQLVERFMEESEPCVGATTNSCSDRLHHRLCIALEEMDHFTDAIIALIDRWREGLSMPLPFMYRGENYLVRMANQYAPARVVATVSLHLRSACRTKPFLYQSPYDMSVAESLMTHERVVLMRELKLQMSVCKELLSLAKAGFYTTVLNIPLSKPYVSITNKKWKHMIVVAYAGALHDVTVALHASSATRVASQFVQCSARALHLRYYRVWMERTLNARGQRNTCSSLEHMSMLTHMRSRYESWLLLRSMLRSQQDKVRGIYAAAYKAQLQRYMRKWFFFHKGSALFRAVQRSLGLAYFRRLHCKVVCRQHIQQRSLNPSLSFVALIGANRPLLQVVASAVSVANQSQQPPSEDALETTSSSFPSYDEM
jgi:hypothetical protein